MKPFLYVHTINTGRVIIKVKNKPLNYPGPGNVLPRHGVLLGPLTWARCQREIFIEAMLLATTFFFDCLKFKTYPPLETDRTKRVLIAETIPLVSSYIGN